MWKTFWKTGYPDKFIKHHLLSAQRTNGENYRLGGKYQMHLLWLTALIRPSSSSIIVYYLLFNSALHFFQRIWFRDKQNPPQVRTRSMCSVSIAKCWWTLFKNSDTSGTVPLWLIRWIKCSYLIGLPRPHFTCFWPTMPKKTELLAQHLPINVFTVSVSLLSNVCLKVTDISVVRLAPPPTTPWPTPPHHPFKENSQQCFWMDSKAFVKRPWC